MPNSPVHYLHRIYAYPIYFIPVGNVGNVEANTVELRLRSSRDLEGVGVQMKNQTEAQKPTNTHAGAFWECRVCAGLVITSSPGGEEATEQLRLPQEEASPGPPPHTDTHTKGAPLPVHVDDGPPSGGAHKGAEADVGWFHFVRAPGDGGGNGNARITTTWVSAPDDVRGSDCVPGNQASMDSIDVLAVCHSLLDS